MKKVAFRTIAVLTAVVALSLFADRARASAIAAAGGDGVETMFSSESDTYQASNPTGLTPFTPPLGLGPYPLAPLSNLPGPPPASVFPPAGNSMPNVSTFNDGFPLGQQTLGTAVINDPLNAAPAFTSDESIAIPFFHLHQDSGAAGYAYEQMDFGANYALTANTGLLGSTPSIPLHITGSVLGGGYAQLYGDIDYTWTPISGVPGTTSFSIGSPVPLGGLTYSFFQAGGGTFNTLVFSSGSLLATPSGNGVLSLDGYMWLAGDPADITVTPEPSSLALLGGGAAVLGVMLWRRRRRARSRETVRKVSLYSA